MPQSPDRPSPRLSIAAVSTPATAVDIKPDPATLLGIQQLSDASLKVQIDKLQAELDSFKQDVDQRKRYTPRLYALACIWLGAVLAILLLQGFASGTTHFFLLSNEVLLALMGATTINVLGLFYVVAKYLFPNQYNPLSPDSKDRLPERKL